jgi:hypothetical protein
MACVGLILLRTPTLAPARQGVAFHQRSFVHAGTSLDDGTQDLLSVPTVWVLWERSSLQHNFACIIPQSLRALKGHILSDVYRLFIVYQG